MRHASSKLTCPHCDRLLFWLLLFLGPRWPLSCRLFRRRFRCYLRLLSSTDQRERVRSAERIPPLRELLGYARGFQFEVHAPIGSQDDRSHIPGEPLLFTSRQRRIIFHGLLHVVR